MKRKTMGKLMLLLFSIIFFLLIAEVASRFFMIPSDYTHESLDYPNPDVMLNGSILYGRANVCIYIENITTGERKPCQTFKSSHETYYTNKSENTFRIAVLGDSFTAGEVLDVDEMFTTKLEKKLNERLNTKNFEVYGFGVPGYNTIQELVVLKEIAMNYQPDFVILQFYCDDINPVRIWVRGLRGQQFYIDPVDFIVIEDYIVPVSIPLPIETNKFLVRHSYFYRFILNSVYIINKGFGEEWVEERETGLKNSLESMREMKEIAEKNNIPFLILYTPGSFGVQACGHFREISNFSKEIGVPYVDIYELTKDYDGRELQNPKEDPSSPHYGDMGNEIIAESLYKEMVEKNLVPTD
ncbi:MAG: hypothetical protein GTN76_03980 [Candidatus Aenigmarchaeota archaeon]|nr:hypothetical protein [Candidatus Aenigmarchaeota archaeon]